MKLITVILVLIFAVVIPFAWCVNVYKLVNCDFEESYKGEVIHIVGVFLPPASLITAWNNDK